MDRLFEFCEKYYVYLDVIIVFLILALVGYFVNINNKKKKTFKLDDNNAFNNINSGINTNMSLQDFVKENKINSSNIKN